MRINSLVASLFLLIIIGGFSCKNKNTGNVSEGEEKSGLAVSVPDFNADSAYSYIVEQIAFGPRVPNTEAHRHCSDYLIAGLKRFGAAVQVQEAILTAYNGDRLNARNIIGSYNPDNPRRITENKRKIKQILDNQALSGISFFSLIAKRGTLKHILSG